MDLQLIADSDYNTRMCYSCHLRCSVTIHGTTMCGVMRRDGQPHLSAIVQARRFSLFSHIARMPDRT